MKQRQRGGAEKALVSVHAALGHHDAVDMLKVVEAVVLVYFVITEGMGGLSLPGLS